MMRANYGPTILGIVLLTACSSSGPTLPPPTVVRYTLDMKTPIQADTAQVGAAIPVIFTITANESDGSSKPAVGDSVFVNVTAGGGTLEPGSGGGVSGAVGAKLTTAADGTAAITWILGAVAGTQTLRGSVSAIEYVDVNMTATKP